MTITDTPLQQANRIAELERLLDERNRQYADVLSVLGDIEQIRDPDGHSVAILCDNPEADDIDGQAAVDACGDFTGWETSRYFGRDWREALTKAADASRSYNASLDNEDDEDE